MKLMLSWIASGILLLVLPLYGQYVYELIRGKAWKQASSHIAAVVVLVSAVFLLGWYGLTLPTAAAAKGPLALEHLTKRNVEEELDTRRQQKSFQVPDIDRGLQIIKVKFDEAEYALGRHDFDRALELYSDIERGSDENGAFATFPCASIKNNMAVAYFEKQRNKGFKALKLLFEASSTEPKPQHVRDLIQRNIDAMDVYLNQ
jgi:hypothetical protein